MAREKNRARTGAPQRAAARVEVAQRSPQAEVGEQPGHTGALAAGQHQPGEAGEVGRQADFMDLRAQALQAGAVQSSLYFHYSASLFHIKRRRIGRKCRGRKSE